MKLRGPGDFFGLRQSGVPMLKMADMSGDIILLEQAKAAAAKLLESDPTLEKPQNRALSERLARLLSEAAL